MSQTAYHAAIGSPEQSIAILNRPGNTAAGSTTDYSSCKVKIDAAIASSADTCSFTMIHRPPNGTLVVGVLTDIAQPAMITVADGDSMEDIITDLTAALVALNTANAKDWTVTSSGETITAVDGAAGTDKGFILLVAESDYSRYTHRTFEDAGCDGHRFGWDSLVFALCSNSGTTAANIAVAFEDQIGAPGGGANFGYGSSISSATITITATDGAAILPRNWHTGFVSVVDGIDTINGDLDAPEKICLPDKYRTSVYIRNDSGFDARVNFGAKAVMTAGAEVGFDLPADGAISFDKNPPAGWISVDVANTGSATPARFNIWVSTLKPNEGY